MKKNNFYTQSSQNNSFPYGNLFSNENNSNPSGIPDANLAKEIEKYSSMSEERLMQEMFHLVEEGRRNGTLDNAKLEEFFNSASCMLSGEQITKLRTIINMAKN